MALIGTLLVGFIATAPMVSADTTQTDACLGVTGTFTTFNFPITGTAAPNPISGIGTTTTLSGVGLSFDVDPSLVFAGIGTGLVQAAPTLADVGTVNPLDPTGPLQGQNAVTAPAGAGKLVLSATHATPTTQTASSTAPIAFTFWVVSDGVSTATTSIYTGTPNPPTNSNLTLVAKLSVPVGLSNTTWAAAGGGNIAISHLLSQPSNLVTPSAADKAAAPLQFAAKINNLVNITFFCWPGTQANAAGNGMTPGPTTPIDTVTVNVPPTAPVCTNLSTSAPAGQSTTIDLRPNCTDVNGNIDPATWNVTTPTAGTLAPTATPGVYTYTAPATDPGVPATFSFSVSDTTALTSNVASGSIAILGNLCDATGTPAVSVPIPGTSPTVSINVAYNPASCSLRQIITVPVLNSTRVMEQAGSNVTLIDAVSVLGPDLLPGTADDPANPLASAHPVILNGRPQLAVGNLNQIKVTNARGDDAGWNVTGQVSSFLDAFRYPDRAAPGVPTCLATDPNTWSNHCIPGGNLGWQPSAAIAHVVIPGDVAQVSAGSILFPPGFFTNQLPSNPAMTSPGGVATVGDPTGMASAAQTLCSSPVMHSGGTFTCNAGLALAVPASAAAGVYVAVLTLTLA